MVRSEVVRSEEEGQREGRMGEEGEGGQAGEGARHVMAKAGPPKIDTFSKSPFSVSIQPGHTCKADGLNESHL